MFGAIDLAPQYDIKGEFGPPFEGRSGHQGVIQSHLV